MESWNYRQKNWYDDIFSQRTENGAQKALESNKNRHIDEENDTPVDVEPMEVLFDTFDMPIP